MSTKSLRLTAAVTALFALFALFAAAGSAHAQELSEDLTEAPRRRQGYYFAVGLGRGASQAWDDDDALGVWQTGHFALRAGQMLTRRLGLGLLIDTGSAMKDPTTRGVFGIAIEGQFELATNFAVRASAGFGALQIVEENKARMTTTLSGTYGSQYGLGLSYDWFPFSGRSSGGFAVTPTIEVRAIPGTSDANLAGFVGVELSYWTGLPRNQLKLPESDAYR